MKKGRNAEEQHIIVSAFSNGQGHLFLFWDDLCDEEKDTLISEVRNIDYAVIEEAKRLFRTPLQERHEIGIPEVITIPETPAEIEREREAKSAGEELLKSGRIACFTAAGGQSSRLGLDIPKGAFSVTPVKGKTLFQVHAEKILFMQRKYRAQIPWIIMVSGTNREQTVQFFEKNNYFGLEKDIVLFIEQGMFPALDEGGKILMRDRHGLFLSPTGHGGTFSALSNSGALFSWLRGQGIQEIFYFQVDNVLVKILDPVFIGYHRMNGCEMSSKAVRKTDPKEKVGVFALEDGKLTVIEYSELEEVVSKHEGLNEMSFTAGSIAIHIVNLDFADRISRGGSTLPLHLAHKAIPYMDEKGRKVEPNKSNGYKIETFIFDALKSTIASIIMEVRREEEFSPLKNRTGPDSPETVLKHLLQFFASWLEDAGIKVPRGNDGLPVYKIEVSPLFAALEEDFLKKVDRGLELTGDIYID
jgi:UDP-N-acetylglucosamine/UDP-N-acetylgalactosamine diphosphorylase